MNDDRGRLGSRYWEEAPNSCPLALQSLINQINLFQIPGPYAQNLKIRHPQVFEEDWVGNGTTTFSYESLPATSRDHRNKREPGREMQCYNHEK